MSSATRLLVLLTLGASWPGFAAAPVRLLISLGSNFGNPDDPPLQYAEADAERMRDLFVELGHVDASRALLLTRATAGTVRQRFAEVTGRVAELKASGREVQLFVFATSHGKHGQLHLTGSELPLTELRALAGLTGADLRVLMVDACEAGTQAKGATRGPSYVLNVLEPQASRGDVVVSSSGSHESAQEWEALGGSLFTHHLLSALRGDGDADGDGRVTLMESFTYAERRTVAQSVDVGQHPQFEMALSGAADVTLTELKLGRARVVLDEALEGRLVVVSQPRPTVVVEVHKQRGRAVALALPPGRYLVRRVHGFQVAMQELELPFGGVAQVDGRRFVTRDYAEVALKGGTVELRPHAVKVGLQGLTPLFETANLRWAITLGYRLAIGAGWAAVSAGWGMAQQRNAFVTIDDHRFSLRAAGGVRTWLGPLTVMGGAAVELSGLHQRFVRPREAEIQQVASTLPPRFTAGFALGPHAAIEVTLAGPVFLTGGVTAWARALQSSEAPLWSFGADADLGVGVRF